MKKKGFMSLVLIFSILISTGLSGTSVYGAELTTPVDAVVEEVQEEQEELSFNEDYQGPESNLLTIEDINDSPVDAVDCANGVTMPTGYVPAENGNVAPVYEAEEDSISANRGEDIPSAYMSTLAELNAKYPAPNNQGSYGTCICFATIGGVEFNMVSSGKATKGVDYSEFHLAEFCKMGDNYYGTNYETALPVLAHYSGVVDESVAPYSWIGKQHVNENLRQSSDVAVLDSYRILNIKENPDLVKQEIMNNGSVLCSYFTPGATVYNGTNISCDGYNSTYKSFNYNKTVPASNHAVTIVGWDDNFDSSKFTYKPSKNGAWLIRNSWSDTASMSLLSYFWMSYDVANLDEEVYSVYMRPAEDKDRATEVVDLNGYEISSNKDNYHIYKLESGTSANEICLDRIGFTTWTYDTRVQVDIYRNLSGYGNLSSDNLVAEKIIDQDITYAGYHTIAPKEEIILNNKSDDTYYLVVRTDKKGIEGSYFYRNGADIAYLSDYEDAAVSSYNIVFNGNLALNEEAMEEVSLINYEKDQTYSLPINKYVRTGYTFVGWNTKKDGSGTRYTDEQSFTNLVRPGRHINLYAMWEENTYTVVFDTNGGTGSMENLYLKYSQTAQLPECSFERENFIFVGWQSDGEEVFCDGQEICKLSPGGEYRLKAVWRQISELFEINENNELVAYHGFGGYKTVVIPEGVVAIGNNAFNSQDSIYTLVIPDSVQSIGDNALSYCTNLTSLVGAKNVASIGDYAFRGCNRLKTNGVNCFVFPDSVKTIGKDVLAGTSYQFVYLGDRVEAIDGTLRGSYKSTSEELVICCREGTYGESYAQTQGYGLTGRYEVRLHRDDTVTSEYKSVLANGMKTYLGEYVYDFYGNRINDFVYKDTTRYPEKLGYYRTYNINLKTLADDKGVVDFVQYINKNTYFYVFINYGSDFSNIFQYGTSKYGVKYGSIIDEATQKGNELGQTTGRFIKCFVLSGTDIEVTAESVCRQSKNHTLDAVWAKAKTPNPVANYKSGTIFDEPVDIYLSCEDKVASIYYTLDGSSPTRLSTSYNGEPIRITQTTTIRAVSDNSSLELSDESVFEYTVDKYGDVEIGDIETVKGLDTWESDIPQGLWIKWVDGREFDYTGGQIKPEIKVFYKKTLLDPKKDYNLKYLDNVNAGTGRIVITGKGNYKDSTLATTYEFTIKPVDIATSASLQTGLVVLKANNKVQKATNTVSCLVNGRLVTLKANRDFKYIYSKTDKKLEDYDENAFRAVGDYLVELEGVKNYSGKLSFTEKIQEASVTSISKVKCALLTKYQYTGTAIEPVNEDLFTDKNNNSLKLRGISRSAYNEGLAGGLEGLEAYDYIYEIIGDNTNAGVFTIKFVGINAYNGVLNKKVQILGKSLKGYTITGIDKNGYVYTGENITPEITVTRTVKQGGNTSVEILDSQYYSVSYSKNIGAGKATVTVTGIKDYAGTLKASYTIKSYVVKSSSPEEAMGYINVSFEENQEYMKAGAKPEVLVQFKGSDLRPGTDYTVNYANNKAVAAADSRNKKGQLIGPKLVINGKGNFKGTSITRYFTIKTSSMDNIKIKVNDVASSGLTKVMTGFTVTDENNTKLVANKDYIYSYYYVNETRIHYSKKDSGYIVASQSRVTNKDLVSLSENRSEQGVEAVRIKLQITGRGSYSGVCMTQYLIGLPSNNINKAKVTVSSLNYKKNGAVPANNQLIVKVGQATLVYGEDYILKNPVNNLAKGTASVTIVGQGDYYGEKVIRYSILPQSILN